MNGKNAGITGFPFFFRFFLLEVPGRNRWFPMGGNVRFFLCLTRILQTAHGSLPLVLHIPNRSGNACRKQVSEETGYICKYIQEQERSTLLQFSNMLTAASFYDLVTKVTIKCSQCIPYFTYQSLKKQGCFIFLTGSRTKKSGG